MEKVIEDTEADNQALIGELSSISKRGNEPSLDHLEPGECHVGLQM